MMRLLRTSALVTIATALALATACTSDAPQQATAGSDGATAASSAATGYYEEPARPQIHLSAERGATGEPHGLVFDGGRYHAFFALPADSGAQWGHAYSANLIDWEHLPPARLGEGELQVGPGSVLPDTADVTGLSSGARPALIAFYTATAPDGSRTIARAASRDGGITWSPLPEALAFSDGRGAELRDPFVSYHPASGRYLLTAAGDAGVRLYASPDLVNWEALSTIGPAADATAEGWRAPQLIPLREYLSSTLRYVLLVNTEAGAPAGGGGTRYFVGDFDGDTFTIADGARTARWLDAGPDFAGFGTYLHAPTPENRRLGLGLLHAPDAPSDRLPHLAFTLPRALTLHQRADGARLKQVFVPDLFGKRGRRLKLNRLSDLVVTDLHRSIESWGHAPLDVNLDTPGGEVPDFTLTWFGSGGDTVSVGYDAARAVYFVDRTRLRNTGFGESSRTRQEVARKPDAQAESLRILLDRTTVELLADDGFTAVSAAFALGDDGRQGLYLDGAAEMTGTVYELLPARPTPESVARVRLGK